MKDLKTEIWKPIKDYEGLYEVSNMGNVRSVDRYVMFGDRCCFLKGKPKKASPDSDGYLITRLSKNGQGKNYLVHRLVAEAFIPNPNDLPFIDHINTIRDDNRVENLRWCSQKENCNNPLTREHLTYQKKNKPVYYIDEQGKKISFKSMAEAQRQTNVLSSYISRSVNKKVPTLGKQWYKEEKTTV